jgi:GDSL-like Lipase/Acylhydrolase family
MSKTQTRDATRTKLPKWIYAVVLFAFVVGALLGGWVFGGSDNPIIVGPIPIVLEPGRYVAIGDSYSAGEGLDPFDRDTRDVEDGGDRCHRSEEFAYPLLLVFDQETTKQFRACSGAEVENVFDVVQDHSDVENRQGLQIDPTIPGEDVRLVTLTIGGNDLDFAKVLTFCFSNGPDCSQLPYKDYPSLEEWIDATLKLLKVDLTELYGRVRSAFPNARILVLGYPALFPLKAPPIYRARSLLCTTLFERWTAPERDAIRSWGFNLNRVILEATQAAGADIEYVDIAPHFAGHEPCSTGGEWVRFVGLFNDAVRDGSFHPLADGQRMLARIVACHLDVFEVPDAERTKFTNYAMTGCIAKETVEVVTTPEAPATGEV